MANTTVLFPPAAYTELQALYMRKKRKKKRVGRDKEQTISFCIPVNVFFSNEKIQDLNKNPKLKCLTHYLALQLQGTYAADLLERRRLYRLRTEAKFSFPLGNATSPAAVPVRPLRLDTASSTSFITSNTVLAVVKFASRGTLNPGGLVRVSESFVVTRHWHVVSGLLDLENARSRIPCIK